MSKLSFAGLCRLGTAGALLVLLALSAGCSGLSATATPQPSFYSLDSALIDARATSVAPATAANSLPTLIVNPPHAVLGFDSQHIIYVREAHKLEYFAHSEWVDTPARMIAPPDRHRCREHRPVPGSSAHSKRGVGRPAARHGNHAVAA